MLGFLSQRLLTVLQLTRMALVFTAISNSLCALLLWTRKVTPPGQSILRELDVRSVLAVMIISTGLYGFGMSLNDIIDRRRDRQLAASRPLPSGRISLWLAYAICILLAGSALMAGGYYAFHGPGGWVSLLVLLWTGLLIVFYDLAGKYLVATGLLALGLIRFFHAVIPAPQLPLLWHPLLLLNHVTIVSTVAYHWEEKRPALTRLHWWGVGAGLGGLNLMALGVMWWKIHYGQSWDNLWIQPGLLLPLAAMLGFVLLAYRIWKVNANRKAAGQKLMLAGLLWLILYDAAFAAGYVGFLSAVALLMLFPIAYLSVWVMRWWAKVILLSQRSEYQRASSLSSEVRPKG